MQYEWHLNYGLPDFSMLLLNILSLNLTIRKFSNLGILFFHRIDSDELTVRTEFASEPLTLLLVRVLISSPLNRFTFLKALACSLLLHLVLTMI